MRIICATFDHNYYLWQCLVLINNLMKYGYDNDAVFLISTNNPSPALQAIINHPKIKSKFFLYKDERKGLRYPSTLRLHIIEKFFIDHPEFSKENIFLVDPDVAFTKKLDFTEMEKDEYWYVSDTKSYIDSKYIKNKGGYKLFNEMCDIVKVSPKNIEAIDNEAGGAQYLLKNVNADFWHKVLYDSEMLYNHMKNTESIYNKNGIIQAWTADMWSILWNGVYFGYKIKISKDLDFAWSVSNIQEWYDKYIFHNAGISGPSETHFSKIVYQISPFNQELKANPDNCTYMYIKEIKETEKRFEDIISFFKDKLNHTDPR